MDHLPPRRQIDGVYLLIVTVANAVPRELFLTAFHSTNTQLLSLSCRRAVQKVPEQGMDPIPETSLKFLSLYIV